MYDFEKDNPVIITQFKWAGRLGFLSISSPCGECDLVTATLRNMLGKEFKDKPVVLLVKPWLNNLFFCLGRGTWHPPIIMVNGRKFYQFSHKRPLFDRVKLAELVEGILAVQDRLKNEAARERPLG